MGSAMNDEVDESMLAEPDNSDFERRYLSWLVEYGDKYLSQMPTWGGRNNMYRYLFLIDSKKIVYWISPDIQGNMIESIMHEKMILHGVDIDWVNMAQPEMPGRPERKSKSQTRIEKEREWKS